MSDLGFWPKFVIAVLATWRITHILAMEDGPGDLIARYRARLGSGFAGKLLDCFQCLSLWIAVPMTLFVTRRPLEVLLTWLALSGGACLLERIGQEPLLIQPMTEIAKGDFEDGMLRSETGDVKGNARLTDNAGRPPTRAH